MTVQLNQCDSGDCKTKMNIKQHIALKDNLDMQNGRLNGIAENSHREIPLLVSTLKY